MSLQQGSKQNSFRLIPRLDVKLGVSGFDNNALDVDHGITGAFEVAQKGSSCKEANVAFVEQADRAVIKVSAREFENQGSVSDIRDRGYDTTLASQKGTHLGQCGNWVFQVLEDVGEGDDVKLSFAKEVGEIHQLDIANVNLIAMRRGEVSVNFVDLDRGYPAVQL